MTADFDFTDFATAADVSGSFFDEHIDYTQIASFEPINQPAQAQTSGSNVQTVSPKDIMVDSMSAPPSTTLTDLTTPGTSYDQSPWIANTSDTSPLFSEADLDADSKDWPSLFESTEDFSNGNQTAAVPQYTVSPIQTTAPKMSRTGSSPGHSSSRSGHPQTPTSGNGNRHSFTTGVSSKRRDKPLPAIKVEDPHDTVAVKRARNTMAARKSRQKRLERTEQLETTVQELEAQVEHWKSIAYARGHRE